MRFDATKGFKVIPAGSRLTVSANFSAGLPGEFFLNYHALQEPFSLKLPHIGADLLKKNRLGSYTLQEQEPGDLITLLV